MIICTSQFVGNDNVFESQISFFFSIYEQYALSGIYKLAVDVGVPADVAFRAQNCHL